jgi:hypothetical protein
MRRFLGLDGNRDSAAPVYAGPISGNNAADPYRAEDVLTIKHGSNEYLLRYPVNTIASHNLRVGNIRESVAGVAGITDPERLSLICAGRKLNDDSATLQSLGIEHGAKILAMGSNAAPPKAASAPPPPPQPQQKPKAKTPAGPAEKIEAVRDHVISTLLPLVNDFISGKGDVNKREDVHRRLSETIMAEVLKLDGVESEDPKIRARRKAVVKEIQGILDSLDKALADFNSA